MPSYLIRWEIELDADSPVDAAIQAANIVKDPESTANVFLVLNPEDETLIEEIDVFKEAGGR